MEQTRVLGWQNRHVQTVKHAITDAGSWRGGGSGVSERAGREGESDPHKGQLQVPGLNADSLHVIKNSLS